MAGAGSRFLNAGYIKPKFLLKRNSRETILDVIFKNIHSENVEFYAICNNVNKLWITKDLIRKNSALNKIKLIFINETRGQAESLNLGLCHLLNKKIVTEKTPFITHNIDTILLQRKIDSLFSMLNRCDGIIDSFISRSKNFSYVKLNKYKNVTSLMEKKVVSNRASSGLYGFSSIKKYINFYQKIDSNEKKEKYISQVINLMIKDGLIFKDCMNNKAENTVVLGTPKEYEKYTSK